MLTLMIMAIEDENDKAFMTWLYLQYRRLIYSEIRKVVGDGDEAEDLLQSVVEKLIGKLPLPREMERDNQRNTVYNFRRWRREYEFLRGAAKIIWQK
jgi:RNA polymerase sigma-70 factor (ECF subfamily)